MDRMLALLGDHQPCFLFRELFLQHMPSDIRAHLVHAKLEDCRALARAADALWRPTIAMFMLSASSSAVIVTG